MERQEEQDGVVVFSPIFRRRGRAVGVSREKPEERAAPAPRPLVVARTLALAHEIARLIEDGTFADQADAARVLGFTRARISQMLDLTLLAPEIQEEVLERKVEHGRDDLTEKTLRRVVRDAGWDAQRDAWANMTARPQRPRATATGSAPAVLEEASLPFVFAAVQRGRRLSSGGQNGQPSSSVPAIERVDRSSLAAPWA